MSRTSLLLLGFAVLALPAQAQVDVAVTSNLYTPPTVTILAGDSVRFTNHGGQHNAQADDLSWRCADGCDDSGGDGDDSGAAWTFERFFNTPGTFRYHCVVHGGVNGLGMSGIITVLPLTIFADDFETGDTSGWGLAFP